MVVNVLSHLFDQKFEFHSIELKPHLSIKVVSPTNSNTPISIQDLSRGTNSVLYIFLAIYLHLESLSLEKEKYGIKLKEDIRSQASIVLIDEIDAHLHPSWQKKIIPLLCEEFPNIQFFVASHSPMVVNHTKDGVIHLLHREAEGAILSSFLFPPVGADIDSVYADFFSVNTLSAPRNPGILSLLAVVPWELLSGISYGSFAIRSDTTCLL